MPVRFFQRRYPSANSVLLTGPRPVLVDTGSVSDADELLAWLDAEATQPAAIVNTHFHTDHVGANLALQARFGCEVGASADEAGAVNRRASDACEAHWLRQPFTPYTVARVLEDGDVIDTGSRHWRVVATPGHTAGHLSLFCPEEGIAVLGDALHQADIGWLSPRDPAALERTGATLDRRAGLQPTIGYPGHGPAVTDLPAALARGRRRLAAWQRDPQQIGWHACKRIFAHALILRDGIAEAELAPFLLECPWFADHARLVFGSSPEAFVAPLIQEMVRADAAFWREGRLVARAEYRIATRPPA